MKPAPRKKTAMKAIPATAISIVLMVGINIQLILVDVKYFL